MLILRKGNVVDGNVGSGLTQREVVKYYGLEIASYLQVCESVRAATSCEKKYLIPNYRLSVKLKSRSVDRRQTYFNERCPQLVGR